jgi:hypothetical protein
MFGGGDLSLYPCFGVECRSAISWRSLCRMSVVWIDPVGPCVGCGVLGSCLGYVLVVFGCQDGLKKL